MKGYAKKECCSLVVGCIFLVGGNLIEFAVPLFLGESIDMLQKGDMDGIGELCLYMLIVIFVSSHSVSLG